MPLGLMLCLAPALVAAGATGILPPIAPAPAPAAEPSVFAAVLLGALQGLTEFLPVSSSGHLVLGQALLGGQASRPGIALELILHAGTLCAVLLAYRRDLTAMATAAAAALTGGLTRGRGRRVPTATAASLRPVGLRAVGLLALATLPVVVAAVAGAERIEAAFEDPRLTAGMLLLTGVLLLLTRLARPRNEDFGPRAALAMGLMQVASLLPGISRSGSTIAGGMFAGGRSAEVVRFCFLMSVPAILGALIFELPEVTASLTGTLWAHYALGFTAALVSGWVAIRVLLRVVVRGRLYLFGFYCLAAGAAALILL